MAYDKIVDSAQLDGALVATADAIRGKTGDAAQIPWDAAKGFADAVESIQTGGAAPTPEPVPPKEVNFYDYDGTLVYAYAVEEAQALTELPPGPTHDGLTFQGWNWSLASVKALTRPMVIGAMYTTDDGKTRLYITLQEGRTSPMLGVGVNGTVTVDWGDGTEPDTLTGSNVNTVQWTPTHHYAAPGDYVIHLTVDGGMAFLGNTATNAYACILRYSTDADLRNRVYQSAIQKVEIGSGVETLGQMAFASCGSLKTITISSTVADIGVNAFYDCAVLKAAVMQSSVRWVNSYIYNDCRELEIVCLPDSARNFSASIFNNCFNLVFAPIPNGVASISAACFNQCKNLASVVFSPNVTEIKNNAFDKCYSVAYYDFTDHTSVPALAHTSVFTGMPDDCEIRVPAALYDEWIAATNWATYADYIKAY